MLLDWLFRPQCLACAAAAHTLCSGCAATLVELGPACPRCAEPTGEVSVICRRCRGAPLPLERIVSPWRFTGALATAIRRLKLEGHTRCARDLAPLWAPLVGAVADADDALVVPVPLHWTRRGRRGFDQTWLLALHACRAAGVPAPAPLLRRVRPGPPQRSLDAVERRVNVADAFVATAQIDRRAVVLVDDVVTTGATMAAAASALLAAGARRVIGVAVARAASAP